jgi:hypothetical protein
MNSSYESFDAFFLVFLASTAMNPFVLYTPPFYEVLSLNESMIADSHPPFSSKKRDLGLLKLVCLLKMSGLACKLWRDLCLL